MSDFARLKPHAQKLRLRADAFAILAEYPLRVRRLTCLNFGFNALWRVETEDGARFALRLGFGNRRSEANLRAELAWLEALSAAGLRVPRPVARRDGGSLTLHRSALLGREALAVIFEWLPGPLVGYRDAPAVRWRRAGEAFARLHQLARGWNPPPSAALPSGANVLLDSPDRIGLGVEQGRIDAASGEILQAVRDRAQGALDGLHARGPRHALHGDLHGWNLKWWRGEVTVFDFDDSIWGVPALDLAIALYYHRRSPIGAVTGEAFLEGYRSIQPLPECSAADLEALIASRPMLLVNDLVEHENAMIAAELDEYLPAAVSLLRAFLEHGRVEQVTPATGANAQ